jgi:phosphatidylethanolamine-binding protein (PEBP) family uncharacterized protein
MRWVIMGLKRLGRRLASGRPIAAGGMGIALVVGSTAGCGSTARSHRAALAASGRGPASATTSGARPRGAPALRAGADSRPAPLVSIEVSIPAATAEHRVSSRYTCDGADESLPLRWNGVPRGTVELALFIVNLEPVNGKLFFDWAVTGLSPSAPGISAGVTPPGAVVGRNSFGRAGYSLCPPRGVRAERFVVRVLALPRSVVAKRGFDAEALYQEAERLTKTVGIGGGIYVRA